MYLLFEYTIYNLNNKKTIINRLLSIYVKKQERTNYLTKTHENLQFGLNHLATQLISKSLIFF